MKTSPRYLDLVYPLDVYAALLQHHAGHLPALGFGSLPAPQINTAASETPAGMARLLIEAQCQQYRKLLQFIDPLTWQQSSSQALEVLDIGCGRGELARQFAAAGCKVTALDCSSQVTDPALVDSGVEVVTADFLEYARRLQAPCFDMVVLQNSARYFLPMRLLSAVARVLRDGGTLIVLEEFIADTLAVHNPRPLPVLDHFVALAGRLGLDLDKQEDLSATTLPFQQLLCRLFYQSINELPALTGYSSDQLHALYQSLYEETVGTETGSHQHVLLRFKKANTEKGSVAPAALVPATDLAVESFRKTFESSFGVDFSPELWRWKYAEGRGVSVAAVRGQEVVAHYGGIRREILYFGTPSSAAQICDVMVMPGERSFFSRKGLFFKTAASMLEQYVGYHTDNLLGFGFPNLKAMHVAERLKLYEKTDELMQIVLAPSGHKPVSEPSAAWQAHALEPGATDEVARQLWPRMQSGFGDAIIGVRDGSYLSYRYQQRPGLVYEALQVSDGPVVKGLGFRRPHGDGWLLMDILAAPGDLPQVLTALLDASQASHFWLTAGQLHRVQSDAGVDSGLADLVVSSTGILIPCNRWSRGPESTDLQGRWWLTAGDMDFL